MHTLIKILKNLTLIVKDGGGMKRILNLNPRELRIRGNGDGRLLTGDDWFGLKESDWTASSTSGGEKAAEDRSFNGEDG